MASHRPSYKVIVREDEHWLAIDVPAIEGVFTQVRKEDVIEPMAREAIALTLDVPDDSFDVEFEQIFDSQSRS
jgi:hypothetical protein